jgi:hypothetical protein
MRPMVRFILGLLTLGLILVGVAFALPSQVTVARSIVINAPESATFPYLNNLHKFADWAPWTTRDPELRIAYSGPESGKGARAKWESSKPAIGTGVMEIYESEPNNRVDLVVDLNGLEGTSFYDIAPSGSGSKVTWGFGYNAGTSPIGRWKGLMLDRLIGPEFQVGLVKLKEKVETDRAPVTPPPAPPTPIPPAAVAPEQAPTPPGTEAQSTDVPETNVPQSTSSNPEAPAPVAPPAQTVQKKKKRQ